MDTSLLISLVTHSGITQWAPEQSGYGDKDGGYGQVQQHGPLLTKAGLSTATAECPVCQEHRPVTKTAPFPGQIRTTP